MKVRQSFVANSSSSSFICDLCGETFTGWDASPSQFDHYQCEHGHIFCDEGLVNVPVDGEEICMYEAPEENCPFCQFLNFAESDITSYLTAKYKVDRAIVFAGIKEMNKRRKKLYNCEYIDYVYRNFNITSTQVEEEIKTQFKNYTEFMEWCRMENK
jgi:hypothetical protein